jgi:uncharacterized protein YjiS (DUF1127 family)
MQRYRITHSTLQLKPANNAAEEAKGRSPQEGFVRQPHRPTVVWEGISRQGTAKQKETAQPSPSTSSRGPIMRFFSRMVEQLVNDFASGAAATHPEAYLMWLEYSDTDRASLQREGAGVAGNPNHRIYSAQTERRADMHAYLTQSQPMVANKTIRPALDIADATPINLDQPASNGWLSSMATAVMGKLRLARETRRGMAALQSMDDRMLKDIGISRYEIEQVSRYGRERK